MCCYSDRKAKRKFLESLDNHKTFIGWKVLHRTGRARYSPYQYRPGEHRTTVARYNVRRPRGFHVYLYKPTGIGPLRRVPVVCHVADLVRISHVGYSINTQQAVLTRIRITRKAWQEAGLPNVPRKRGR